MTLAVLIILWVNVLMLAVAIRSIKRRLDALESHRRTAAVDNRIEIHRKADEAHRAHLQAQIDALAIRVDGKAHR